MEALIKMVAERAGIDEGQATQAVEVVIGQLKERLPEPIASQLEGLLDGEGGDAPDLGGALGGIGEKLGL
jgi:uncharacterized protein (DUF2267 family)